MQDRLNDIFRHQEWADAEHWRAIRAHPPAWEDSAIGDRLCHIRVVGRAFLSVCRGEQPEMTRRESFGTMEALYTYGRSHHAEMSLWIADLSADRLDESVFIPWFSAPPLQLHH